VSLRLFSANYRYIFFAFKSPLFLRDCAGIVTTLLELLISRNLGVINADEYGFGSVVN
jgi:hypothetical protein